MRRNIAIIGTAGRDKKFPMTLRHWDFMCQVIANEVKPEDHLISGGAAWADHVAVWTYINGLCDDLTLHLPAPIEAGIFAGGYGTSGGAARYYHERFSALLGHNTTREILEAIEGGAAFTEQPVAMGYAAMTNRNRLVAEQCDHMIAFTFGAGSVPADGGTQITWNMAAHAERVHVSLLNV